MECFDVTKKCNFFFTTVHIAYLHCIERSLWWWGVHGGQRAHKVAELAGGDSATIYDTAFAPFAPAFNDDAFLVIGVVDDDRVIDDKLSAPKFMTPLLLLFRVMVLLLER